jgi:signal transduction histidine kinase
MIRFFRTWSFQMTVLFAALFAISPTILFIIIYRSALAYATDDYREEIEAEFNIIMDEAGKGGYANLPSIVDNHLRLHASRPTVYLLEDPSGNKLSGNIDPVPTKVGPLEIGFPGSDDGEKLESYMFRTPNSDYLLIGEVSEKLKTLKKAIVVIFAVGGSITIAVGILFGLMASSMLLARLRTIAAAARGIAAGDMLARVPSLASAGEEFEDLGRSINLMLERIEELMRRVRHISSDIAHDLRTPLSLLKQNIEGARFGTYAPDQLQEVLEQAGEQVDTILNTFESLLKIAQIEAGRVKANAAVDLSSLLTTVVEDFAPAAEDRGQILMARIEPNLNVVGEERLLVQLAINLIENAISHTPPGTRIRLAARRTTDGVLLEIGDDGPGIPVGEFPKITRPFYRIQSSREIEGNGLGLSLVSAISEYHNAVLSFRDNSPGLTVTVLFPA